MQSKVCAVCWLYTINEVACRNDENSNETHTNFQRLIIVIKQLSLDGTFTMYMVHEHNIRREKEKESVREWPSCIWFWTAEKAFRILIAIVVHLHFTHMNWLCHAIKLTIEKFKANLFNFSRWKHINRVCNYVDQWIAAFVCCGCFRILLELNENTNYSEKRGRVTACGQQLFACKLRWFWHFDEYEHFHGKGVCVCLYFVTSGCCFHFLR